MARRKTEEKQPLVIGVSEFKARCLELLDALPREGGEIIVTKRGVEIARVRPYVRSWKPILGRWKGRVEVVGDLVKFSTASEWKK